MADVATLGLKVDGGRAFITLKEYDAQLARTAASGQRVEAGQKTLGNSMQRAASGVGVSERATRAYTDAQRISNAEIDAAAREYDQMNTAASKAAVATEAVENTSRRSTQGIGRLNNALFTMTRRVTGANTVTTQLVDVLGTFAIGVGTMTAIIGGVTALALAWSVLTRDAREAKEELKENLDLLQKIREEQELAAAGGATAVAVESGEQERIRIERELAREEQRLATLARDDFFGRSIALGNIAALEEERTKLLANVTAGLTEVAKAHEAQVSAADAVNERLTNAIENARVEAETRNTLARISTEFEIAEAERRDAIEREILGEFFDDEIAAARKAEKARTTITAAEARERARVELREQRELMRNIRAIAQGADILGGAVGGRFGSVLQGAAGGGLTGAGLGATIGAAGGPIGVVGGAIIGGVLGGLGGLLGGRGDEERERAAAAAEQAARQRAWQIEIARQQLEAAQDAVAAQERVVDTLTGVVDTLSGFSDSLRLSNLSILSPAEKLQEARAQFDALASLALGGDVSAAESLPESSRRLLEASRAFNASGAGFVNDFNRVQTVTDTVRDMFVDQLTVQEQMLEELRRIREAAELAAAGGDGFSTGGDSGGGGFDDDKERDEFVFEVVGAFANLTVEAIDRQTEQLVKAGRFVSPE